LPPISKVKTLRAEARQLKEALAEATLENRLLKKSVIADSHEISRPREARDHCETSPLPVRLLLTVEADYRDAK
jgi:hypothetical protein